MEEQDKVTFHNKITDDKILDQIPDRQSAQISAPSHSPLHNIIYEKAANGNVMASVAGDQGNLMGPVGHMMGGAERSGQKRKYVKKRDLEDPAYSQLPSTSLMFKRRRKRRVSMGGMMEVKGTRPVNERNIERVLNQTLHLTDTMLQMLLSTKDDLKRLCGGSHAEGVSPARMAQQANNRKLTEIVDKINKAYVDYHKTIDDIAELGKGPGGEEEEEEEDFDEDEEDEEEYGMSSGRYDNGDEQAVVKKRAYHRRQPYHRKQVKTEGMGYHAGNQGNNKQDDKNNYYNSKKQASSHNNNGGNELQVWEIKKEKAWDWSEERGQDVSNDLVMTCEPGSDDESLYNVGFPKFSRNF